MTSHLRLLPLVMLAVLVSSSRTQAQTSISGRVLDADGKPVAKIEVLLHAITDASGSQVDKDTSSADGAFELRVAKTDPKSIYFVAVMHDGQLYMGELLRPPFPTGQEYIVRVGVNPVDLSGGMTAGGTGAAPPPQEDNSRAAGAVVIVVAVLVIASLVFVAVRRRPPERRRLLVELARLEEEMGGAPSPSPVLEKRRLELRNQLLDSKTG